MRFDTLGTEKITKGGTINDVYHDYLDADSVRHRVRHLLPRLLGSDEAAVLRSHKRGRAVRSGAVGRAAAGLVLLWHRERISSLPLPAANEVV